jgi:2-polyprenyl-3-methyl-5-hydroxy-6-metoxy-1,4-benzoquinol methylase
MSDREVKENEMGFWEIALKPDAETLARYYREKYFGATDGHNQYAHSYTSEELEHKFLDAAEAETVVGSEPRMMLEVGCGEGFFLDHFRRLNWFVNGIDFTSDGIKAFFPDLETSMQFGDAFELLLRESENRKQYDFVVCNNVLEHVIDPLELLQLLKKVLKPQGILRITVPNDFSWLQNLLVDRGNVPDKFWVCPPDHLNYFNVDSICNLLSNNGWEVTDLLASFPIDLFLLNEDSNYVRGRERGRACHFARVAFEMGLWKQGIDKLISFRRGCAAGGVGRDLAIYAKVLVT